MPYLDKTRKQYLDTGGRIETPGDLTYMLTVALLRSHPSDPGRTFEVYADAHRRIEATVEVYMTELGYQIRYADFAVILGCLDSARREFVRRARRDGRFGYRVQAIRNFTDRFYREVVAPYEDGKIEQNGDVYPS